MLDMADSFGVSGGQDGSKTDTFRCFTLRKGSERPVHRAGFCPNV